MTNLAKNLLYVLAFLAGINLGYFLGHWSGKSDGKKLEHATQATKAAEQNQEATKSREKIENETRHLSDPDLINDMRLNGWLR